MHQTIEGHIVGSRIIIIAQPRPWRVVAWGVAFVAVMLIAGFAVVAARPAQPQAHVIDLVLPSIPAVTSDKWILVQTDGNFYSGPCGVTPAHAWLICEHATFAPRGD